MSGPVSLLCTTCLFPGHKEHAKNEFFSEHELNDPVSSKHDQMFGSALHIAEFSREDDEHGYNQHEEHQHHHNMAIRQSFFKVKKW